VKTLAIIGASGHGKVLADMAELLGYNVTFFDDAYPNKLANEHWPIAGNLTVLLKNPNLYECVVVAIGNNQMRNTLCIKLINDGFKLPTLIHPTSVISKYAKIADGSVFLANSVVNAFAQIGRNCIINTGAIIEHDCVIGEAVHVSPNVALAGGTKVGDLSWLGIGSLTKQLVEICENTIIGANTTVINNIPSNVMAVGTPAVIKKYL
jgi:sugar O-acyltransferase (sialic acid O-acetyltransferase NeuD family)